MEARTPTRKRKASGYAGGEAIRRKLMDAQRRGTVGTVVRGGGTLAAGGTGPTPGVVVGVAGADGTTGTGTADPRRTGTGAV